MPGPYPEKPMMHMRRYSSHMKWNPFLNAGAAVAYIGAVALFMGFLESARHDKPDTLLDGMGFISLFVFSVAVMAFLFFYQPLLRLIEGKRAEALSYFLKTLGIFGAITLIVLTLTSVQ
jgi:NADH:ubiquinone oxidoreductase subunit 6 (subunit J)